MSVQAMTQQATRHARRVYVGGLPLTANEQSLAIFFSHAMSQIGGNTAGPGDAVVNVGINLVEKTALVEMRSVEEASNAMALDGINFEGATLTVRRPIDYNRSLAATLGPSDPNPSLNRLAVELIPGSAGELEGPNRIFVGGLPYYLTEKPIRELLESVGPLRGFDLVKDRETGNSKGYAFCVYQDLSVTDFACAVLNGIEMGDKTLTVRRANQGATQPKSEEDAQQQSAIRAMTHRVFVEGIPRTANEQSLAKFFSHVMSQIGGNTAGPGDAVVNVGINLEEKTALVEMRSVEEASNAMALDGINFEGAPLTVGRPYDYNHSLAAALGPSEPNPNLNPFAVELISGPAGELQGPYCIFVDGLPCYSTEVQIRKVLELVGALRDFVLVRDRETGNSKGQAFCVYQDLSDTDIACAALNGIKMSDSTLTVRRANQGATQPKLDDYAVYQRAITRAENSAYMRQLMKWRRVRQMREIMAQRGSDPGPEEQKAQEEAKREADKRVLKLTQILTSEALAYLGKVVFPMPNKMRRQLEDILLNSVQFAEKVCTQKLVSLIDLFEQLYRG